MNILSINFNHDGSGVILKEGKIAAFVNTERFSRVKKHPGIREEDLDELLDQAQLTINNIDLVLLCNLHSMDSPDIFKTYKTYFKETWFDFWIQASLVNKVLIRGREIPCVYNPNHHLLHCSLVYYTSNFNSGVTFSWDPTGYGAFYGKDNKIYPIDLKLDFNANEVYSLASEALFETGLFGAGKVMGLAPYGYNIEAEHKNIFELKHFDTLYSYSQKDSLWLNEGKSKWNASLAYNAQRLMEEQLVNILEQLYQFCEAENLEPNLCISGGGALNSVANQIAFSRSKFRNIFMHPACGDDGTAIGAALWYWHNELNNPKKQHSNAELMYSIRSYDHKIETVLENETYKNKIIVNRTNEYLDITANLIAEGNIIGWFQGASEIGPRALGNRSILADPRKAEMKDILNSKVKFREGFRPFAPSVLNEHAKEWFGIEDTPFMLRVSKVLKNEVPSITHIDNTARIQTLIEQDNPSYYKLIEKFYKKTKVPLLIDTSFNIKGEPIVETPEDALNCFLNTGIDYLVFPGIVIGKTMK